MTQPYHGELPADPSLSTYIQGETAWLKQGRGGDWRNPIQAPVSQVHRYRGGNLSNQSVSVVSRNRTHATYNVSGPQAVEMVYIRGVKHVCCRDNPAQMTVDTETGRLERLVIYNELGTEVTIRYSGYGRTDVERPRDIPDDPVRVFIADFRRGPLFRM
ncbi:hypothetical protein [Halomicrobium zhouii]|nr:hypothetical protein [Halomicrobium zhouii]